MSRTCPNCFRQEGVRFNFGGNISAESKFHNQSWCDCGYSSPTEMMQDQELGFNDPRWVLIAKYFLNEYYLRIGQGRITNIDEHLRFFLKLLKRSANNYRTSIELMTRNNNEDIEYVYDGKPTQNPKKIIFKKSSDLEHLPERVILETLNNNILIAYNQSKVTIAEFTKREAEYRHKAKLKNRLIAGLIALLLISVLLVFKFMLVSS